MKKIINTLLLLLLIQLFFTSCNDKSNYIEFKFRERKPNSIEIIDRPITIEERDKVIEKLKGYAAAKYYINENGKLFVSRFIQNEGDFEATLCAISENILYPND